MRLMGRLLLQHALRVCSCGSGVRVSLLFSHWRVWCRLCTARVAIGLPYACLQLLLLLLLWRAVG